jgi:hypothetical protein
MELYGSLLNISGSVTASTFTGSFIGDGSGLTGIQASGVTGLNLSQISSGNATASISTTGFTVNKNTQIQGNLSVTGAIIANEYIVSSSVVYMTTSFASGSSAFGNDNNDVHQFTGSVQITGSISLNGQAIGTGKLDETTFQAYTSSNDGRVSSLETSSGSLNSFTSSINTTIKSKLDTENVISGSIQVNITGTTGYSTFSSSLATITSGLTSTITSLSSSLTTSIGALSSSIATTDLNQDGRLTALETSSGSLNGFTSSIDTTIKTKLNADGVISGSSQILNSSNLVSSSAQVTAYGFATTGSNLFKGTQTHSGSILPSVDNAYDLGSAEYQWRDVYISSGSLYIDGTKVISSTAQELQITTDNGQSIKILEGGTDSIILQTADGNVELKSNADGDILLDPTNGKIMLKGPVEVLTGQKIQSSVGGTPVVFANDIVVSGSIDLTGTIDGIDLQSLSSSLNTRIGGIETATGSLNSYTSSNTTNINAIHTATSSLNSFTSSINTTIKSKLDSDGVISGSVQIILTGTTGYSAFSSSVSASIGNISGSIATTTSGLSSSIGSLSSSLATTTSGLTSTITSLSSSVSSSIGSLSSSVATTTSGLSSTITSLSSSVATTTSGLSSSIGSLSSSVATTNLNQDGRLTSIEGKTGSYATTGSNVFQGDQTVTGSLFISQNLIVGGSSSINFVSQSTLNIGTNIITVNAQNPGTRFGGLSVIDSGSSPTVSGSMLFDSVNDQWLFVHQAIVGSPITSSVLLMGPQTLDNLGAELYPTTNRVLKSVNAEHVGDSNISDDGTTVTILSNTVINGTISSTGTTIVSGSSQISHDSTTGYVANRHIDHTAVSISAGSGLSGGGDISATRTVSLDTGSVHFLDGVKKELNTEGVISGSSQVLNGSGVWSGSAQLPSGVVSGSSQVLTGTGIWSGSAQLPSGVVSGSSQVLAGTTIHSGAFFNGISVVSGSAQISFNGITDKPTLVSGSSQITYGSLSGIPSGIVSGSSQITFGSITGVPGGLVSGSSQIDLTATTNYSTGIKTRLNAEGVVSGSSQISYPSLSNIPSGIVSGSSQVSYTGLSNIPSGIVSGSAQITLSSTTGYGSVLNQAVLTSSSPTFAGLTNNGTYTQATTSTQPLTINGDSGDTNGLFRIQMDSVSDSFASGARTYLGDGGIDIFLGTSNSSYTPSNTYIALNHSGEISMGAGSATKHFTLSTSGNLTISGTIGASNFSGTSSGTNTGDQTLNSLGALSSNTDSEQVVGCHDVFWNYGTGVIKSDARWNESGYDGDLGTLHMYSTTAAGANYGRAGIALYNGSAYQYLTTKASTTGLFANNSLILTAGNYNSYALPLAGGTMTGIITTVSSGTAINFSGQSDSFGYNATSGQGTYIKGTGSTYVYGGGTFFDGSTVRVLLHSGNFSSYAMSGAGYSANQNLNTSNSPTFAGLSSNGTITITSGTPTGAASNNANSYLRIDSAANQYIELRTNASATGAMQGMLFTDNGVNGFIGFKEYTGGANYGEAIHISVTDYSSSDAGNGIYLGASSNNANGVTTPWFSIRGGTSYFYGNVLPDTNNSRNLGSASFGWANVYTNDLHLSNMNKPEGNDIDGTSGNWTIQEGAENLYIINNNNGKKFKISLEEII